MSAVDDEALSMRWLAARIAPVRGWIAGAAISGVLATAAYATFAAALAQLLGRWSRGDLTASGWLLAFAVPAALIARSVLHAIKEWSAARASVAVRLQVRDEVLDALATLGPLRSSAGSDGALASVLIDQVDALDGYVSRYRPQQLIVLAVPVLIAVLVVPSSWLAALILIGTAPLIPMFMVLVGRQAAAASTQQAGALARLGGQFLDLVRGLPTLRLLGRVDAGAERLDTGAQDYRRRSMQVLRIAFLSSAVLELFASIAIAMVALYLGLALLGRFDVGHYGLRMTLDKALLILLLAPEFFAPLRQLGSDYHARAQAIAAAAAIRSLLDRVPALDTIRGPGEEPAPSPSPSSNTNAFIEFDQVTLQHADGRVALDKVSFRIERGERVLLRGASGAGKSSVLALLAGFATPTSGRIMVDGHDLSQHDRDDWWRDLAWLEQRPEWFAASVRDNVLIGLERDDRVRLWTALERAGLADDVRALPLQAETPLGQAGSGWSGGQLQRIALARGLARDASLWLLDEPLAHLDRETADALRGSLDESSRGRTVLIASHDDADRDWVDRVLTLDTGRLVQVGA